MSKIVSPSLILYKVESVRNKDLNLDVSQSCDLFFLYLVRQCAKKRGRRKANHLLTFALIIDILAFLDILVILDAIARLSRKEVFQPHLPVRLPCYDLAPITGFTLGRPLRSRTSGAPGFHGLTGGVYKARERIHRAMADVRLLANPASWGRVADPSPN